MNSMAFKCRTKVLDAMLVLELSLIAYAEQLLVNRLMARSVLTLLISDIMGLTSFQSLGLCCPFSLYYRHEEKVR
jgi:hypothetical protein